MRSMGIDQFLQISTKDSRCGQYVNSHSLRHRGLVDHMPLLHENVAPTEGSIAKPGLHENITHPVDRECVQL